MCEFTILELLIIYCSSYFEVLVLEVTLMISFNFSENFFKPAGEVVDVRFATGQDDSFRGFGHVEFATAEAAQKVLFILDRIVVFSFFIILLHVTDL